MAASKDYFVIMRKGYWKTNINYFIIPEVFLSFPYYEAQLKSGGSSSRIQN